MQLIPSFYQVLTKTGWVPLQEALKGEPILTQGLEYKSIISWGEVNHKLPLYEVETDSTLYFHSSMQLAVNNSIVSTKQLTKGHQLKKYGANLPIRSIKKIEPRQLTLYSISFKEETAVLLKLNETYFICVVK